MHTCKKYLLAALICLPMAHAATAPVITKGGVVPLYGSGTSIQPGEWISIYGTSLAASTATWAGTFPTTLNGTSVTIDGRNAYLWYVSPTQINAQVPNDTNTGAVNVVVTTAAGSATSAAVLVGAAPSFSLLDSTHVAAIIPRANGSGHYGGGAYDIAGPAGSSLGYVTVPAKAGDTVELYAVGCGATSPAVAAGTPFAGSAPTVNPVLIYLAGYALTPSYSGLVGPGLYQINITIPTYIPNGDQPLMLYIKAYGTQSTTPTVLSVLTPGTPQITSLVLSPISVTGGATSTGTLMFSLPTPAGTSVYLTASNPNTAVVSVPPSLVIPAGATSATFTVTTGAISSAISVTISASYVGSTAAATLTIQPSATSQCASAAGEWYATENGTITGSLIASGQNVDTETYLLVGGNNVNISQSGCTFTYYPIINSNYLAGDDNFVRTGNITGNNVTVTGQFASLSTIESLEEQANPGLVIASANVSKNLLSATGTISATQGMNLQETGSFIVTGNYSYLGQSGGYTYTLSSTSTALFTPDGIPSLYGIVSPASPRAAVRIGSSRPLSPDAERILPGLIRDLFTRNLKFAGLASAKISAQ